MKNASLDLPGWPKAALISVATIAKKRQLGRTSIVLGIVRLLLLPQVAGIQPRHAAAPQPSPVLVVPGFAIRHLKQVSRTAASSSPEKPGPCMQALLPAAHRVGVMVLV